MKLSEYLSLCSKMEREAIIWRQRANELVAEVMKENSESSGTKYPTFDSLWKEVIHRAEEEEKASGAGPDPVAGSSQT